MHANDRICPAEKDGNERKEGLKRRKRRRRVASNGYSRINPSIMSSVSEFPQCAEARDNKTERDAGGGRGRGWRGDERGSQEDGEWALEGGGFCTGKSNSKRQ